MYSLHSPNPYLPGRATYLIAINIFRGCSILYLLKASSRLSFKFIRYRNFFLFCWTKMGNLTSDSYSLQNRIVENNCKPFQLLVYFKISASNSPAWSVIPFWHRDGIWHVFILATPTASFLAASPKLVYDLYPIDFHKANSFAPISISDIAARLHTCQFLTLLFGTTLVCQIWMFGSVRPCILVKYVYP